MTERYCPSCFNHWHPFWRAARGWLAWQVWRVLPARLALGKFGFVILPYAGEWIYDTRACGCRVPLIDIEEVA